MFYKDVRKLSRELNKNKYIKSFLISVFALTVTAVFCVLPFLCNFVLKGLIYTKNSSNTSTVLFYSAVCFSMLCITLLALTFYSSISLGKKAWYSGRLTKRKLCFKRLLYWFKPKNSFKALGLKLIIICMKLLWAILFIAPALIAFLTAFTLAFTGGVEVYLFLSLSAGGVVLLLTGLIFTFIISQRYFLAPYLLAENPKLKIITAIKQSKNLTEGQIFTIVRFKLCFLPSFLLYPLIFTAVYFHPHYNQSCCIIAKELRL